MKCRSCKKLLKLCFIDLGNAPPSNSYLTEKELNSTEIYYPLQVYICDNCWLAQVIDYAGRDIFFNEFYPYFSSVSNSFTSHSKKYVDYVIDRFNLKSTNSQIIEIASNDGYLLQFFKKKNFNCLGIEPSKSCAKAARKKNIKVLEKFFDFDLAKKLAKKNLVDLIVANNVLAHVPDINNFVKGISILLKKKGVVTFEFPHLLELIKNNQYDTIYHEHYSYLSLIAVNTIFEKNGLNIFDVQKINTHGGSLRVFAQKKTNNYYQVEKNVSKIISIEKKNKLNSIKTYKNFQKLANENKNELLNFLIECKSKNLKVAAFGAAAKGNTLLNYAGIKKDLISFVCDSSKSKQNKFLPGTKIPIFHPDHLQKEKPDYLLILPWNIADEIKKQLSFLKNTKTKLFVAIPKLKIL
tara:strand:+ start:1994 stop:3220 length:1227 start_codon:yes stop_codon:yes gene_type:complete